VQSDASAPRLLLHITTSAAWAATGTGSYAAPSLRSEGFIHCSTATQVLGTAHALFRGQGDLVLLCIDAQGLRAEVVYEDCYEAGQLFPHVYGPIDCEAVIAVVPFVADNQGRFSLPPELQAIANRLGEFLD
tara:strand:+ start:267 stop:662 length:396 start_codon:yes stop_codon:yes gene_type:complete